MGKDLRKRIKKNSEDFYKLYQEGKKKINISNNLLVFLLLSAIEEISKCLIEILLDKCNNPQLRY
ncbi:hypothetical protein SULI_12775 [Saccharolobus solfataricus]|uniref:Uncharacterized protein n=3 Tax=Saccharolobus solfataricus TaxID=2287 RepID=Q97XF7_SACS2|nr:hypothetical protein [Saccharolobus solfataricus]AAK41977.1 Hypothetical protein SSO8906 [Saccharolobus solfataricus P2]AKA74648.1 hypothetical protein SULB_2521 [Saccharolobus solfataricus]AKA77342.1 hypothetical protein SULC_2516 [Saccharolobus solfataricus]AKA80033.1 hypothetical protein SULA_2518 [Saccharolobus solfataricus]AZF69112.1 hypothetical protein SULG_12775 [Saccharolobus solfataricus]